MLHLRYTDYLTIFSTTELLFWAEHSGDKHSNMVFLSKLFECGPSLVALFVVPLLLYFLLLLQNRRPSRFPRGPFTLPLFGPIGKHFTFLTVVFLYNVSSNTKSYEKSSYMPVPFRSIEAERDSARAGRHAARISADDGPVACVRRHLRSDRLRHAHSCDQFGGAAARSAH